MKASNTADIAVNLHMITNAMNYISSMVYHNEGDAVNIEKISDVISVFSFAIEHEIHKLENLSR